MSILLCEQGIVSVAIFHSTESVVKSLSYSPNGAHLAVGLASGEVQVFDIDSNCCIFTLEQHKEVSDTLHARMPLSSYLSSIVHA